MEAYGNDNCTGKREVVTGYGLARGKAHTDLQAKRLMVLIFHRSIPSHRGGHSGQHRRDHICHPDAEVWPDDRRPHLLHAYLHSDRSQVRCYQEMIKGGCSGFGMNRSPIPHGSSHKSKISIHQSCLYEIPLSETSAVKICCRYALRNPSLTPLWNSFHPSTGMGGIMGGIMGYFWGFSEHAQSPCCSSLSWPSSPTISVRFGAPFEAVMQACTFPVLEELRKAGIVVRAPGEVPPFISQHPVW